ncbi:MAG: transporter ATP-binding protein [Dehalococcoidia bacterium]|nr:transporter ATP-binding protein [Dehalococcoidia bacterium]
MRMIVTEEVLAFEDVTFGYGATPAVQDITLSVRRGEYVALIGPNGSGKTTLVRLALGLERPQQGRVRLFGVAPERFRGWQRVGYVPQRVADVVAQGEYRRSGPGAIFRRGVSQGVKGALEIVGMADYQQRLISDLSVGQQRRVLIARAIVHKPDLLILDEPTSSVDRWGQEEFYSLLRRLREEQGVTILLASHDVGVVLHEASKVACVNGRLERYIAPSELTDADLSDLFGHGVDLIIHRHS